MNRKLLCCIALVSVSLLGAVPVLAGSVFVSQLGSGNIVKVDELGTKTIFASGLDKPAMVKFDKHGNLFVFEFRNQFELNPRVLKITPTGDISIFAENFPRTRTDEFGGQISLSYLDMTVADDGAVFLLVRVHSFSGSPSSTEIWEVIEGGTPILLAAIDTPDGAGFRQTIGPGGHLYFATNGCVACSGESNNQIIRVTRTGQVSTFFEFPLPPIGIDPVGGVNLMDVRFDSNGDMLLLAHKAIGSNFRAIYKLENEQLLLLADVGNNPGLGSSGALTMTIDADDNLFLVGGGSVGSEDGFIQQVDPSGNVTTLALFPNSSLNAMFYIDDDSFDSFPLAEIQVPVDIGPRRCPNRLKAKEGGSLRVAILGTESFDATQVDPVSARLMGVAALRLALKDVATPFEPFTGKIDASDCTDLGRDGFTDLTLKFDTQEIIAILGDVQDGDVFILTLTGNLLGEFGGTPIRGEDVVLILKKGN